MTSPALLRCVFRAFLILQLTTLYSGHMASESLTLLVMRLSIISGKWKVLLRMPGFTSYRNDEAILPQPIKPRRPDKTELSESEPTL